MNVTELIQRTRDIIADNQQQAGAPKEWEDDEVLRHLNSANETLWKEALLKDEQWGIDYFLLSQLSPVVGAADHGIIGVFLPDELPNIKRVEELGNDSGYPGEEVAATSLGEMSEYQPGWQLCDGTRRGWMPAALNNGIFFTDNKQTFDSTKIRIWFHRPAPKLARFTVTTYPTTSTLRFSPLTPTLGVMLSRKNYYRNAGVFCLTVGSSATPQGKRFFVSSWDEQTHPNWDMVLATAHGLTTGSTIWEILPVWPEEHHDLLCWIAASRCFAKGGDRAGKAVVDEQIQGLYKHFVDVLTNRQIQTTRHVLPTQEM